MNLPECRKYVFQLFRISKEIPGELEFTSQINKEISRIGYATNLTPDVVDLATKNRVQLIITHHDAWKFVYGMKRSCLEKMRCHQISHFYVHLPLDAADIFGTNEALLQKLGASVEKKTTLYDGYYCGRIGVFEKPMTFRGLVRKMNLACGEQTMSWQNNNRKIKRIGLVTGGGGNTANVKEFVEKNCDVYITGEKVLYTIQYAAFAKINLIVGSHTFTELLGVENLANLIVKKFPGVEIFQLKEKHVELQCLKPEKIKRGR